MSKRDVSILLREARSGREPLCIYALSSLLVQQPSHHKHLYFFNKSVNRFQKCLFQNYKKEFNAINCSKHLHFMLAETGLVD